MQSETAFESYESLEKKRLGGNVPEIIYHQVPSQKILGAADETTGRGGKLDAYLIHKESS